MTISLEPVQIQRLSREKLGGEFKQMFKTLMSLDAQVLPNGAAEKRTVIFRGNPDVKLGDRCVAEKGVYDVMVIQRHGAGDGAETVAVCEYNDFETTWNRMQALGCDMAWGKLESTGKDQAAEDFMDSWVGTYIRNIVTHYDDIANGRHIGEFFDALEHKVPAAIVGAGPSLDTNAIQLHGFPGVIICVDRAYKMLLARGIEPDFVISVDCHYDLIAEMLTDPASERHTLILNSCADPEVAKNWKGRIFWYNMVHPGVQFTDKILPALFPEFGGIMNAGCVGNTATLFADYLGCSPLVFVGQDYAYTGKRMHATQYRRAPDGAFEPIREDHATKLEARSGKVEVDGETTYFPFIGYRDTAYGFIESQGLNVINATEGGILNKLPRRSLSAAIEMLRTRIQMPAEAARKIIKTIEMGTSPGGKEHGSRNK